jgi:hypothetical protein
MMIKDGALPLTTPEMLTLQDGQTQTITLPHLVHFRPLMEEDIMMHLLPNSTARALRSSILPILEEVPAMTGFHWP